jgi:hypothetical protein
MCWAIFWVIYQHSCRHPELDFNPSAILLCDYFFRQCTKDYPHVNPWPFENFRSWKIDLQWGESCPPTSVHFYFPR